MGNSCSTRAQSSLVDETLRANAVSSPSGSSLSLALRKLEVFTTAARVFSDYKITSWRADQMEDEEAKKELWDAAHDRNARLLCAKFTALEALWIKMGQYLSSRADVMPAAYLRELAVCQDSLDPAPFSEVRAIVEAELGRPLDSVFASVEQTPLAVASIAAVYRAVLLDGRHVVIKVQHARVRSRLLLDLKCLESISGAVRWLDADFDFSPIVREWASEVPRELDFSCEAENMSRVARNLAPFYGTSTADAPSIDVSLARVIEGLATERLLVMSFVDGFKVNSSADLKAHQVDKELVMTHITRAYAQQIFGDGFYSADPHPGNLLLDRLNSCQPVLLDFGLTKTLTPGQKFHFAKLIVAADEGDIHGLLQSLEGIGLKLRPEVPFDIALLGKYFFRDAAPQAEAKAENAERRQKWRNESEARKRTLYAGDKVTVTSTTLGWRTSRNGEVLSVFSGDAPKLVVKLTDGSEVTAPVDACKLQSGRMPFEAWPDAFIFFERVLNLLRGLTASLDVKTSYLQTMTPYARLSLRRLAPPHARDRQDVHGLDELRLSPLLAAAIASGEALGCQVSVRRNGRALVELAAGSADPYERVPMEQDTLVCCFSVTKAVAAASIHLLAQRGLLQLDQPVSRYWPAFGANCKQGIRVCDALEHKAGLQDVGTHELSVDPLIACDSERMMRLVAEAAPDPATLGRTSYHYLSFGWILEGLVRAISGGQSLRDFAHSNFAAPLEVSNEFGIGLPPASTAPRSTLVLQKAAALPARREAPAGQAEAQAGTTAREGRRPPASPSLLLNPTYFNTPAIAEASLPSANGHFSARALTAFYAGIAEKNGSRFPEGIAARLMQLRDAEGGRGDGDAQADASFMTDARAFLSGFVLYSADANVITFGHSGLGGSVGLCRVDTGTGDVLSVAVTLNRLSFDSKLTRQLVRHVFGALELAVPAQLEKE